MLITINTQKVNTINAGDSQILSLVLTSPWSSRLYIQMPTQPLHLESNGHLEPEGQNFNPCPWLTPKKPFLPQSSPSW